MSRKVVFSILIPICLIFIFTGSVSADSNQITIEFDKDGMYHISTPDNYYYNDLINEIYTCICKQNEDVNANITTLKNEVTKISHKWGIDNPDIEIKTPYGDDTFYYIAISEGISMEPTIKDGDMLVINKTRDFQVGDIVSAYYQPRQLDVLKRVAKIDGDEVYLISDNANGTLVKNGELYEYKGLRAWVNMSDIRGVLIDHYSIDDYNYDRYRDVIMN